MPIAVRASKLSRVPAASRSHQDDPPTTAAPAFAALCLDRNADVPIGVQLAWAIKAKISDGSIGAGERLPGLRDLADALSVNANTVRAVYARLESEGLLQSRHGSGTFVAAVERSGSQASAIAARAAREAHAVGIDPRKVASALYVQGSIADPAKAEANRRSVLRAQIAALDQALNELEAEHPAIARRVSQQRPNARASGKRARLPSAAELDQAKGLLLRRIGEMQTGIEAIESDSASADETPKHKPGTAKAKQMPSSAPKSRNGRGRQPGSRPATAGA